MAIQFTNYSVDFDNQLKKLKSSNKRKARFSKDEDLAKRVAHMAMNGGVTSFDLERYMGTNDLLRINYLRRGIRAAGAVCRVRVADPFGGGGEWGTGFLITPHLLITNHHVIESENVAQMTIVEFGYEADADGFLQQGTRFRLRPQAAFITSKELDYTVVAIEDISENRVTPATSFGFLRLIPALHKIDEFEFVTIIQHPNGDEKYIAIRENKLLKIGSDDEKLKDNFLWYSSDTSNGSSGAPAFNDQWQVVAVHHRGVAESRLNGGDREVQLINEQWVSEADASKMDDNLIKYIANEGVRTSKIVADIEVQQNSKRLPLIKEFLDDVLGVTPISTAVSKESMASTEPNSMASISDVLAIEAAKAVKKHIRDVSYYNGRNGYSEGFLGINIPLPKLTQHALNHGSVARVKGTNDNVLRYTNFSLVHNESRKLAFYTAVNIDGKKWVNLERGSDKWFYDPRLSMEVQVGDELYGNETKQFGNKGWFDRGHLVRRLDPVWGSMQQAALANEDTFHWSNCSPQFWGFNQGADLWQGLENFILYNTDEENVKATVFNGPIFMDSDEEHRDILIPQYYWKVVVVVDKNSRLYSSAYVISQKRWAQNIPFEALPVGEFNNFQVSVAKLESRTGIDFSATVRNADVYKKDDDKGIRSLADVEHPRR